MFWDPDGCERRLSSPFLSTIHARALRRLPSRVGLLLPLDRGVCKLTLGHRLASREMPSKKTCPAVDCTRNLKSLQLDKSYPLLVFDIVCVVSASSGWLVFPLRDGRCRYSIVSHALPLSGHLINGLLSSFYALLRTYAGCDQIAGPWISIDLLEFDMLRSGPF